MQCNAMSATRQAQEVERQLREAERQLLARDRVIADLKMRLPASQDKEKINRRIADLSGGAHQSGTMCSTAYEYCTPTTRNCTRTRTMTMYEGR